MNAEILTWCIVMILGAVCGWGLAKAWPKYYFDDEHKIRLPTEQEQRRFLAALLSCRVDKWFNIIQDAGETEERLEIIEQSLDCSSEAESLNVIIQDLVRMQALYWEKLRPYYRLKTGTLAILSSGGGIILGTLFAQPDKIRMIAYFVVLLGVFCVTRKRSTYFLSRPLPEHSPYFKGEGRDSALEYLEELKKYWSEVALVYEEHCTKLESIKDSAEFGIFTPVIVQALCLIWFALR